MATDRRRVLALTGALLTGTAGCIESGGGNDHYDDGGGEGADEDDEASETPDCDVAQRHQQGTADPIETSVSDDEESCGVEAARAAVQHAESELDMEFDSTWGSPGFRTGAAGGQEEASVNLWIVKNTDGDVVACPPLSFDTVVGVTPAEVTVTMETDHGDDEKCTHEIYVDQIIEQEA